MKKLYIGILALAIVMAIVFGGLYIKDMFTASYLSASGDSPSTSDEPAPAKSREDKLSVKLGECSVIALEPSEERYVESWTTSDNNTVSVDSGGRMDALKEGKADVSVSFSGGTVYTYHVTVEKSEKQSVSRIPSTAITANTDIEEKNYDKRSEKLPYEISVNRKLNCVTVYTYDDKGEYNIPVRAMVCSCGKDNRTILGEFEIYFKGLWHPLYNNVFGQYVSGFSGDFLFHSVPYVHEFDNSSLKTEEFNKLGTPASLGCVRLAAGDACWIFERCSEGTKVRIFDSDKTPELGIPEPIKISDLKCGWDPTDRMPANPYLNNRPRIEGAENITLPLGGVYSPTDGVKVYDTCGSDVTEKMEITGNVVTSRRGTYKVTYKIIDAVHRTDQKTITVTVE